MDKLEKGDHATFTQNSGFKFFRGEKEILSPVTIYQNINPTNVLAIGSAFGSAAGLTTQIKMGAGERDPITFRFN